MQCLLPAPCSLLPRKSAHERTIEPQLVQTCLHFRHSRAVEPQ